MISICTESPTKSKRHGGGCHVSFSTHDDVIHIENSAALVEDEESNDLWFTDCELKEIQTRALNKLKEKKSGYNNNPYYCIEFNNHDDEENGDDTLRGLELYATPEYKQAAQRRRSKSLTAVITWPKKQHTKYGSREKQDRRISIVIARAYSLISEDAIQHAIIRAVHDRNWVIEFNNNNNN